MTPESVDSGHDPTEPHQWDPAQNSPARLPDASTGGADSEDEDIDEAGKMGFLDHLDELV